MNGATAEPLEKIVTAPRISKIRRMGKSHHFLRFFKKSQSSLINSIGPTKAFQNRSYQIARSVDDNKIQTFSPSQSGLYERIGKAVRVG